MAVSSNEQVVCAGVTIEQPEGPEGGAVGIRVYLAGGETRELWLSATDMSALARYWLDHFTGDGEPRRCAKCGEWAVYGVASLCDLCCDEDE